MEKRFQFNWDRKIERNCNINSIGFISNQYIVLFQTSLNIVKNMIDT